MNGKEILYKGEIGIITAVNERDQNVVAMFTKGRTEVIQNGKYIFLLTDEEFKDFPNSRVFAHGIISNSPSGVYMTETGGKLRWVAQKRGNDDWCVYVGREDDIVEHIRDYGDKITTEAYIRRCVPCTDELFKKYGY